MLQKLREFFDTTKGRGAAIVISVVGLIAAVMVLKSNLGESEAAGLSRDRVFICSQTLKPFNHSLKEGETIPVASPHSGKQTGFPAEACYWTKDGKTRDKPYAVLLNMYVGKREPTFCPDCNRLVRPHNPNPQPGGKPPPTKEEYAGAPLRYQGQER